MRHSKTHSCEDYHIKARDRVRHVNHGTGTVLFVYKDTGCEVRFDTPVDIYDDIVIVSIECLSLLDKEGK